MLTRSSLKPLLLPLRSSGRRDSSTWLQFCSPCLAEKAQPYFRRRWRLATQVACATHRCGLRDRCPSCHSRFRPDRTRSTARLRPPASGLYSHDSHNSQEMYNAAITARREKLDRCQREGETLRSH
ncbi:TniQ family protein [Rhizobium sp. BK068]|uniref:TniQ family protein n=1 Tax=Rhizobium sp. BK068 TaxID=2512130 RepID=UPI001FE0FFDE|nr:TniQ family protein [Rhizobium sp. BK068]